MLNLTKSYKEQSKSLLYLAVPIMLGQVGHVLVNLVDNLMVGQLGATALAAIAFSNAIFIVFLVLGMGVSFALPPLVSEAVGAKEEAKIPSYFSHSMVVNIVFAFLTILLIELSIPLLDYFRQDAAVLRLAIPYLKISSYSLLPLMIFQTLRCYADGMSETKPAMIAMLITNVFNVIFNYILIFGKFGFPAMGAEGAAWGSLLARIVMLAIMIFIVIRWKDIIKHIHIKEWLFDRKEVYKKILWLGVPSSLQGFFEVTAFAGASIIMGMLSKEAQAAHQVAISLASLTFLVCSGLGMAATVKVGNAYGAKNKNQIKEIGLAAIVMVTIFMAVAGIGFIIGHELLPKLYIDDPEVLEIASILLFLAAIFQIPDGVQVVVIGALRGVQDILIPTLITFVSYWMIGIPFSYYSALHSPLGSSGVWMGLIVGLSISAICLTLRFYLLNKATRQA